MKILEAYHNLRKKYLSASKLDIEWRHNITTAQVDAIIRKLDTMELFLNQQVQKEPDLSTQIDSVSATAISSGINASLEAEIQKGRAGIARILSASDDEIRNRKFLLECVCDIGIGYQDWHGLSPFTKYHNSSSYGIQQIPTELVDYLLIAGASRPKTVAEVGVFRGGTSYVSAAYFYRLNKDLSYTLIDVRDELVDYSYFASVLPLEKAVPMTSGHFVGKHFELVFIDADHSYDGSRIDWLNVGRYADVAAFHDINAAEYDSWNGGIRRNWNELKLEYRMDRPIIEISHHPSWMGIGLIFNNRSVSLA